MNLVFRSATRYGDGECLSPEDENVVVEKLLAYHPRAQDKIGCGLDAIMVFRFSRATVDFVKTTLCLPPLEL
jgi:hypothetical protein